MLKDLLRAAAVAFLFTVIFCKHAVSLEGVPDRGQEIARTWDGGFIFYPKGERFSYGKILETLPKARTILAGKRFPTIVYMHGCSGIDTISKQTARDYVIKGTFVVVMPDSFAREDKPDSCNLKKHEAGLHRNVIFWRQNEANNAIREARKLPFVDPDNIFLIGMSEGAITTATTIGEPVNARISEGWTCHAGWPEYFGLHAPIDEPVLSFTSIHDPWFKPEYLKGNCGRFMDTTNGSKSVVFDEPHILHDQHFVSWHKEVQHIALTFLRAHMR